MSNEPTPPSATESDRVLALLRAITSAPPNIHVTENAVREIRAHTSAAVAEAVKTLESELEIRTRQRDYWQEERNKLLKTNGDLARKYDFEAYHAAESERDSLRALVVRMRELLSVFDKVPALIVESTSPENALESVVKCITLFKGKALALVPADLADSVCVKRSEWERLQRLSEREFKSP